MARPGRIALRSLRRLATWCGVWLAAAACASPVAERPLLRVGTSGDYAPFSERGPAPDAGYRGLDVDVARAFAADTGLALRFVPFRWPELTADLGAGRFDVAMSGVTVRPERSVAGRFTVPVTQTGAVLIVRASEHASRAKGGAFDVAGLRIAVNAGGHLERVTRASFPSAEILAVPDNAAVPTRLATSAVDAVVTDTLEAPHWLGSLSEVVVIGPFTRDFKAYWLPPGNEALAQRLDAWLLAREADGTLARLRAEWLSSVPSPETALPRAALLAACDERLALMPFVAGFKRAAGLPVVDPAREETVLAAGMRAVLRAAAERGVAPPPADAVRAFYRAQIDAAVEIQEATLGALDDPALAEFDLATELRPALIRIGDRMAGLIVETTSRAASEDSSGTDVPGEVDVVLARHALSPERRAAIAAAVAALAYADAR